MAKYIVIKTHGDTYVNGVPLKTQCGGAVKTVEKAYALMARMRAQQPQGDGNWFSIETVR